MTNGWTDTGKRLADGRPIYHCPRCGAKTWGHRVAPHLCKNPSDCVSFIHRVEATHGCCGSPVTTIYGCQILTYCTTEANDGTLELKGKPVASCAGCPYQTVAASLSPAV